MVANGAHSQHWQMAESFIIVAAAIASILGLLSCRHCGTEATYTHRGQHNINRKWIKMMDSDGRTDDINKMMMAFFKKAKLSKADIGDVRFCLLLI